MSIDEFLEGMAELHPMIHRRALDLHSLEGDTWGTYVKYIKWTDAGCEVHLRQDRPVKTNHVVTLTKRQLKQSNEEWATNLQRANKARVKAAAERYKRAKLQELADAKAAAERANEKLAQLQADLEERKAHARSLITRNNLQGGNNDIHTGN
jgi:hypothetical protein